MIFLMWVCLFAVQKKIEEDRKKKHLRINFGIIDRIYNYLGTHIEKMNVKKVYKAWETLIDGL